jgi:lysophospholipase L1-like esterase
MGYQPAVTEKLRDMAEVWAPEINCGPSSRTVEHLNEWIIEQNADVYHINAGLHDLRKEYGSDAPAASIDDFTRNIKTILRAALAAGAKVIWATITPVNQRDHHEKKGFDRFEADVDAYNQAALAVVADMSIPVNDLFGFVMERGRDDLLRGDGVHFTPEAYELLGDEVARFIRERLD